METTANLRFDNNYNITSLALPLNLLRSFIAFARLVANIK
jgi:hypothetical protein